MRRRDRRRYPRLVLSRPRDPRRCYAALIAGTLLALSLALISAPVAIAAGLGGGSSFNELTKSEPEATRTRTTAQPTTESSSTSNSKVLLFAGGAAAVVLLGGIAYFILRDARRVAPAGDAQLTEARSRSDAAARARRRRARAKAARQQRKRNR
jgi:hypothetical protein